MSKRCLIIQTMILLLLFISFSCISPAPSPEQSSGNVQEAESDTILKAETGSETILDTESKTTKKKVTGREKRLSPKAIAGAANMYAAFKTPGGRVLAVAADLVVKKELILGSCWTYINAVYDRAGFPGNKRERIIKTGNNGPYGDHSLILPGDWVMYRNLPYREGGHSAIFVEWIDFERRSALTIEYVGNKRKLPGRYREADITKLFGVLRGME